MRTPIIRQTQVPPSPRATGQALVEFVLVMPILLLILVGGYNFGLGAYEALLASDAVEMPALGKLNFSNQPTPVDDDALATYMNGTAIINNDAGAIKIAGSLNTGNLIDKVTTIDSGKYTSIIVGSKNFVPIASFVPGFTIRVGQAINKNLLQAASQGAKARPYKHPWVPGDVPNPPPW